MSSCERHANHATTFRNHAEAQYVNKHVGEGVRGCVRVFLLNSWDIWHPWTPCPLSQNEHTHTNSHSHTHTHIRTHTHTDLNNEVSCLPHTLGPPFMPHPFTSSPKSISCAVTLRCYTLSLALSHTHTVTHKETHSHSVKIEVRSWCWEMRLLLRIITVEDWLLPGLFSINISYWSGCCMPGLPAALFVLGGKGNYYD